MMKAIEPEAKREAVRCPVCDAKWWIMNDGERPTQCPDCGTKMAEE
jgi:DNA-directed RNA polymerase subunit RPC12/RpoP